MALSRHRIFTHFTHFHSTACFQSKRTSVFCSSLTWLCLNQLPSANGRSVCYAPPSTGRAPPRQCPLAFSRYKTASVKENGAYKLVISSTMIPYFRCRVNLRSFPFSCRDRPLDELFFQPWHQTFLRFLPVSSVSFSFVSIPLFFCLCCKLPVADGQSCVVRQGPLRLPVCDRLPSSLFLPCRRHLPRLFLFYRQPLVHPVPRETSRHNPFFPNTAPAALFLLSHPFVLSCNGQVFMYATSFISFVLFAFHFSKG